MMDYPLPSTAHFGGARVNAGRRVFSTDPVDKFMHLSPSNFQLLADRIVS
jgi:hypothetical protein